MSPFNRLDQTPASWSRVGTTFTATDPKAFGNTQRVDLIIVPPVSFVPTVMQFHMVEPTERYSELVADLFAQGAWLCKLYVMCVGR